MITHAEQAVCVYLDKNLLPMQVIWRLMKRLINLLV